MLSYNLIEKRCKNQQDSDGKADSKKTDEGEELISSQNLPGDLYIIAYHNVRLKRIYTT